MVSKKNKRKNKWTQPRTAAPSERRHVVSYDDIEQAPVPPVPRHKVSYASDSNSDDDGPVPEKRHEVVSQQALKERERPQTDITYGQTGAFPGLDARDKEPFYGPANDGLDYLRMVRSEARQIPHIVAAPPVKNGKEESEDYHGAHDGHGYDYEEPDEYGYDYGEQDEHGYGYEEHDDSQGWYEDGAYVARHVTVPSPSIDQPGLDPQQVYYDSLKARFNALRRILRTPPSLQQVQSLDQNHPISFPTSNRNAEVLANKEWKGHIQHSLPLPAQLASMDSHTTLHLLKLVEGQLENCRSTNIPHNISLWMWSLLARLDDVGLLHTRDVSLVRDLAKMAIWVRMMHQRAKQARPDDYDPDQDEYEDNYEEVDTKPAVDNLHDIAESGFEEVTDNTAKPGLGETTDSAPGPDLEETADSTTQDNSAMDLDSADHFSEAIAAKKRELMAEAKQSEEFPDLNTCATIDMVITIAGEFYGQKDLLNAILPWDNSID